MALSPQVREHLNDAVSSLRSAIWHAAKNERPSTIGQMAKLLNDLDVVAKSEELLDNIDDMLKDLKDKE